ncbi:SRPBCC family protein [Yaniella flava]|uniref:SRPBCC family protein n=1 Tax=Yaniella flava TaxID=287930 RepID=UPI0031D18E2D
MGFSRRQTIYVALQPDQVWDILTDPGAWLQFDDQLQQFSPVHMTGNRLQVADRVKVVPKALVRGFVHAATAPPATITTVAARREIAWRQTQPGGFTQQRWQLRATVDGGTELTRHTEVVGPLAAPLGAALAAPLAGDVGAVGARMVHMASTGPDVAQPLTIIAGGSGYLGQRLATRMIAAGQRATVLTRQPTSGATYPQARWGQDDLGPLHELLMDPAGVNIVNLAGKRLGPRFTPEELRLQRASRIVPTETLRAAVTAAQEEGAVVHRWIQGSAVPLWGSESTTEFTEATSPMADTDGPDGMGRLVTEWEAAAPDNAVFVRTGIVLGQHTEITKGLTAMARSTTRPSVDGFLPWIHEDDWVGLVQHLLAMHNAPTKVVAVAPQQTRLSEVIHALVPGQGPRSIPVPAALLRTGMNSIGMEPGLLMGSTRARSIVIDTMGYEFLFPTISSAGEAVSV